ncbi:MAG: site-specific DNA-methyltransferase [Candidatus Omnitrophota bacterium]
MKKRKKYGLVWEEKSEEVVEMCKEKLPVLKEIKNKGIITDKDKLVNLLIEGDNYHALSVLNYTHAKKIDVIYIDPPYNTGNKDFKYNDKWVDIEDSYRHSKWLSFMEKRLLLAKNLLKNTGVIFISIDDNEVGQLKLLCNEIFGQQNFVGQLIWRKKEGGGQTDMYFVTEHEYILVYQRTNKFTWLDKEKSEDISSYNKRDKYGNFRLVKLEKWGSGARREDRPTMYFPIIGPDNKKVYPIAPDGNEGRWRVGKSTMDKLIEKHLIHWEKKKNRYIPYEKVYYNEQENKKVKARSILYELANTGDGTNQLTEIFAVKDKFQNPKPIQLINFCLNHSTKENSIVLDFFAGSGTTGHAVVELNKEDGCNRKFILCTNNEDNNGNGFKISEDICYPRVKKAIEGYKNLKGERVEGLGGNLKYFKTDFVDAEPTDRNKIKLTEQTTEMLCVKEGTFESVVDNKRFKIFKNSNHYTGIIWDQSAILAFKKTIKDIKGRFSVYVFSLGDETFDEEFKDVKQKVQLSPIPEAILRVYRGIFK